LYSIDATQPADRAAFLDAVGAAMGKL